MKYTYNQLAASGICLVCVVLMGLIYFFPSKGAGQELILGALISVFTTSASYFVGSTASSSAKDTASKDTTDKLIDAVANSTPVTKNS